MNNFLTSYFLTRLEESCTQVSCENKYIEKVFLNKKKDFLLQDKRLFCLSEDTVLLANYAANETQKHGPYHKKIIDLGAGQGGLGLLFAKKIAHNSTHLSLYGIEKDLDTLRLLHLNYLLHYPLFQELGVIRGDLCKKSEFWESCSLNFDKVKLAVNFEQGADIFYEAQTFFEIQEATLNKKFDIVLLNPPYRLLGKSLSPQKNGGAKKTAFVQDESDLELYLRNILPLLDAKARIYLIFPFARFNELMQVLAQNKLALENFRPIYPKMNKPSKNFLATLRFGNTFTQTKVMPPLIIRKNDDTYTEEVLSWYDDK